jgi:hypothetical protein
MKTATAPSPFLRAVDSVSIPDRFLPGDGRLSPESKVEPAEDFPLTVSDFENTREAVRAAEERLARIQAEEAALERRREEALAFQHEVNSFERELFEVLNRLRGLEGALVGDEEESRQCAVAIHQASQDLRAHLERLNRIDPEQLANSRTKAELDLALDFLEDIDHDAKADLERLQSQMPQRVRKVKNGWMGNALYWMTSAFAFVLPLLVFAAVAVILVLTALGLV